MRRLKITKQITDRSSISLRNYLNEVSTIDMISPEREIELSTTIQDGDESDKIKAVNELVSANLRFGISVAKQYGKQGIQVGLELKDLINESNIGLIKAAYRFEHQRGFKFISYAVWWTRQSILQAIAETGRSIRLPQNKITLINSINRAISQLEQLLDRNPTPVEISDFLNAMDNSKTYKPESIDEMMVSNVKTSSLDQPLVSDGESGTLLDVLEDYQKNTVEDEVNSQDLSNEIKRVLQKLTVREKYVIIQSFGLFNQNKKTIDELGMELDLTRERVRQIREKVIKKLRSNYSSKELLKVYM